MALTLGAGAEIRLGSARFLSGTPMTESANRPLSFRGHGALALGVILNRDRKVRVVLERGASRVDELGAIEVDRVHGPCPIRFDQDTIKRLQAVAAKKHKGYQTLLKEFVAERLYEEEKREGMLS